jgi:hypothetical protein
MTFDSMDALKNYILSQSKIAVQLAQEKVFLIINRFVKEYYAEFSPAVYERTYQLFRSLVKTDVKSTGNGWVAEVYFDVNALDYHMKRVNGVEVPNKGWSEEETLAAAARGEHGGYKVGTAIWADPFALLDQQAINMLKQELINAGIPLK